jgi:hypothetical protein
MQFNFSYAQGVSQTQMAAFEMAGKIWSSYLTDDVTINIAVDVQKEFAGNTIAGAIARSNSYWFGHYAYALRNDADPTNTDQLVVGSQTLIGNRFEARYDVINTDGRLVSSQENITRLSINSANAKSVGSSGVTGMDTKASNVLDGYIVMRDLTGTNTSWSYNFNRQNTVPTTSVDFIGVAIHEIGHVLGFQSSIDRPWVGASNLSSSEYKSALSDRVNQATPLDLFRYSDKSRVLSETNIDLSVGGNQYFGLGTNGTTFVGRLDNGTDKSRGGNGFQASHWESGGIMDAEVRRGQTTAITGLDLIAFDAIGWDIATGGINKMINYAQLEMESKQIASQKTKQNLDNAMALMFDSSDIYAPKGAGDTSLEARKGGWWQQLFARKGGWWQEYFARTGGWWQGIKEAFGGEAIFDSIEGGDIELLLSSDVPSYDRLIEPTDADDVNPLTGKTEGAPLVGEVVAQRQFFQRADVDLFQPHIGFQSSGTSVFDQQDINNRSAEFSPSTESAFSNVVGNRNVPNLVSVISNNFQLTDTSAFTPLVHSDWWMSR